MGLNADTGSDGLPKSARTTQTKRDRRSDQRAADPASGLQSYLSSKTTTTFALMSS